MTRLRPMRRFALVGFLGLLATAIAAFVGASWYLWAKQRELIFVPTRGIERTPADVQLHYEDVRISVGRGAPASLHGWWLPSADPNPLAVLYLHGNDLNIGGNVEHVAELRRLGFSVLAVDYRGYGKSDGAVPSESQLYDDAEAAWDHLIAQLRVEPGRAFIYGHSMGGVVAIELALRRPEAAGVIVESAFTSMPDVARLHYWMFPVGWLLNQRFDALARVPRLTVPVLFIHGTADAEVPYTMSERLFAETRGSKTLTLVSGGGHEDNASAGGAVYRRAVLEFARANHRGR